MVQTKKRPHAPESNGRSKPKAPASNKPGNDPDSPLADFAAVIHGMPGVGKTTLASAFPRTGFVIDSHEQGINRLLRKSLAKEPVFIEEADSFKNLCELVLSSRKQPIGTLVVDSLTGGEKLCFAQHCREYFDDDWSKGGFYAYGQGPKNAARRDWPRFIDAVQAVQEKGIAVLLLAHTVVRPYNNPSGPDYDRYVPYLEKEVWQATSRWAGAVLYLSYDIDVKKEGPKHKAEGGADRVLRCQYDACWEAKNQYGLPASIPMGRNGKESYQEFMKKLRGE